MTYFFFKFPLLLALYNYDIFILYVCLSIKFFLRNSSQTDTNSFLTPVFPAALLTISISNISTRATGFHGKIMAGTEVVIPFLVYRDHFHPKLISIRASISSFCWLSVQFHFCHCFSLRRLLNALFQHNYQSPSVKMLSCGVVSIISSYSPGVPTYFLLPTIILFSFIFVSLFPMLNLQSLIFLSRNPKVISVPDWKQTFASIVG